MSQSINSIQNFVQLFRKAKQYNSKEIRLSIDEASSLMMAISELLSIESELNKKVINLQELLLKEKEDIQMSGGSF